MLPGTLVSAVLRTAAAAGDAVLYDRYLEQMRKPGIDPEEYYRFFGALPSFQDPQLVQRTLTYSISPDVRSQDTATLIAGLTGQPGSRHAAWTFVKAQWPTLLMKLGTFQGLPGIIGSLGSFCSQKDAADVKQFFTKNPVPSSERTLQQALERIDACEAVVKRQLPALTTWLRTSPGVNQANLAK
jgi:aminopeptidase N